MKGLVFLQLYLTENLQIKYLYLSQIVFYHAQSQLYSSFLFECMAVQKGHFEKPCCQLLRLDQSLPLTDL